MPAQEGRRSARGRGAKVCPSAASTLTVLLQSVATITEPPPKPPLPPNAALAQSPLKRGDWQPAITTETLRPGQGASLRHQECQMEGEGKTGLSGVWGTRTWHFALHHATHCIVRPHCIMRPLPGMAGRPSIGFRVILAGQPRKRAAVIDAGRRTRPPRYEGTDHFYGWLGPFRSTGPPWAEYHKGVDPSANPARAHTLGRGAKTGWSKTHLLMPAAGRSERGAGVSYSDRRTKGHHQWGRSLWGEPGRADAPSRTSTRPGATVRRAER